MMAEAVEPLKALLLLKDKSDDAKDKLIWKWIKGEKTEFVDFGAPVTTDDYTLCIYEASGVSPSLLLSAVPHQGIVVARRLRLTRPETRTAMGTDTKA